MRALILITALMLTGCQNTAKTEANEPVDLTNKDMRHGWTILTGPKRTLLGVNDKDSILRGKKLYAKHCAGCHGKDAKGDGFVGKSFNIKPANLTKISGQESNYYLVLQINNGRGSMPKWQDLLTPRETWDLSNYIQSLN